MPENRIPVEPPEPARWRNDLNPEYGAGQNYGLVGPDPAAEGVAATAYDIKDLNRRLPGFTDAELKAIPVLPAGTPLEQGATYLDLRAVHPHEFTALGNESAEPDNWYVPKKHVGYVLWNKLIGVSNPARLDEAQ